MNELQMKVLRQRQREQWGRKLARRPRVGRDGSPVTLPSTRKSSRILIVSQATVDGVAVCVRDLVQAAAGAGYRVTVACPAAGNLPAWIRQRGAAWERLEMRRRPHPSDIMAVMRLRRLARTHDLIHLHSSKAGVVGRLAVASLGPQRPPVVFTPHGWVWLCQ